MQEGDVEVYSLLTAQSDDSAQVFFLSGGTIKTVAYKGAYIKSTGTVSISPRHASGGFTAISPFITPRPTYTPNPDGSRSLIMASPTPMMTHEPATSPPTPQP